jgi:hypothetical protein
LFEEPRFAKLRLRFAPDPGLRKNFLQRVLAGLGLPGSRRWTGSSGMFLQGKPHIEPFQYCYIGQYSFGAQALNSGFVRGAPAGRGVNPVLWYSAADFPQRLSLG